MPPVRHATLTHPTQNESGGRLRGWNLQRTLLRGPMSETACGVSYCQTSKRPRASTHQEHSTTFCGQPAAMNMQHAMRGTAPKSKTSTASERFENCKTRSFVPCHAHGRDNCPSKPPRAINPRWPQHPPPHRVIFMNTNPIHDSPSLFSYTCPIRPNAFRPYLRLKSGRCSASTTAADSFSGASPFPHPPSVRGLDATGVKPGVSMVASQTTLVFRCDDFGMRPANRLMSKTRTW